MVVEGVAHDVRIGRQTEIVAVTVSREVVIASEESLALAIVTVISIYEPYPSRLEDVRKEVTFRVAGHMRHQQAVARHVEVEAPLLAVLQDVILFRIVIVADDIGHRFTIPCGHTRDCSGSGEFLVVVPVADPPLEGRIVGRRETVVGIIAAIHQIPLVEV